MPSSLTLSRPLSLLQRFPSLLLHKKHTTTRRIQIARLFIQVLALVIASCLLSACNGTLSFLAEQAPEQAPAVEKTVNNDPADDPECFISKLELEQLEPLSPPDIWERIRSGYALPEQAERKRTQQQLAWYTRHPSYMERVAKRGERYLFHIVEALEARNMPLELALLPIVESAFDPFAYSHGRASGIWQIIPGTGRSLGLKQNWWYDGRRDIVASTRGALDYLEKLHKRFDGDWLLAVAAYNSGGGNVSKAIRKNKKKGLPTDFWNLDLPRETEAYVPRLIALSKIFLEPSKYELALPSVANVPHFEIVDVETQIDLAQAAEFAGISMDRLYHLNPGFNRWATDPKGPHRILVPVSQRQEFEEKLGAVPKEERVTWSRYTIKSGDSLSTIAQKYNISVSTLQTINDVNGTSIRAGKTLMVPTAAKSDKHYSYSQTQRLAKRHQSTQKKKRSRAIDYRVKPGDSFWTISREFKVSVAKIARWNNMAPKDPIRVGQKLKIWSDQVTSKTDKKGIIRKVVYTVRNGDSLHRIADKFHLNVNDIVKWNEIAKSKYLQPGQSLTLFVDVTRTRES